MPVPSSSLTTIVDDSDPVLGELAEVPAAPAGLLECFAKVTDPRKRRGVRHSIVALALAATLAGAQSFVAIGEWVADAGTPTLRRWASGTSCRWTASPCAVPATRPDTSRICSRPCPSTPERCWDR